MGFLGREDRNMFMFGCLDEGVLKMIVFFFWLGWNGITIGMELF